MKRSLVRTLSTLVLPAFALLAGCQSEPPDKPGPSGVDMSTGGDGGGSGTSTSSDEGPCEDGETRTCKVDLGTHHGVTSCFEGVQTCTDGAWGACLDPTDPRPPPPEDGPLATLRPGLKDSGSEGLSPRSSGPSAEPCIGNVCDPSCMQFVETPASGLTPPEDATPFDWETGTVDTLSPELLAAGSHEPCAESVDCQMDQVCVSPVSGSCAHSKCVASPGVPLVSGCDPCVQTICAVDPSCCSAGWTDACVAKVSSICGAVCPPPACDDACPQEGQCTPWLAGQRQPDCAGPDLTVGVACSLPGGPALAVCNRGSSEAPSGVPIAFFPPGSGLIPALSPSLSGAKVCATDEPIPPGECIDVPPCGPALAGAEIMINPPMQPGSAVDCHPANNWTLWPQALSACAAPACAGGTARAGLKKVNLFFAVDRSGSMLTKSMGIPGTPTRWAQMTDALKAFAADPKSAGLGVWMRLWPYNKDSSCPALYPAGCQSAGCATPNVPLGSLTAQAAPADTQEQAVFNVLAAATPDSGGTPMYPALKGVLSAATAYELAHPNEATFVILVTDGEPTQCDVVPDHIASLASSARLTAGVKTFVIGIADVSEATISAIAQAGGGQHFVIGGGGAIPVESQVLDALESIRTTLVACAFALPDPQTFDAASMAVSLVSGAGAEDSVQQVASSNDCGAGGWYYDDPQAPAKVLLCPSTCATLRADPASELQLHADCPGAYAPVTHEAHYLATCPVSTRPVWGFLAYDTVTPSTSSVEFRVVTAESPPLPDAPDLLVAVAKTSTGTSLCSMAGPAPCPIDLSNALGGMPADGRPYLRLRTTLLPSANAAAAPTVNQWKLAYSCVDAE